MNAYNDIKNWFSQRPQRKLLDEWKKAFALKRDYEVMSEIANYIMEDIVEIRKSHPELVKKFLYGTRQEILESPVLREIKTDVYSYIPETLGELIEQIDEKDFQNLRDFAVSRGQGRIDLASLKYVSYAGCGARGLMYQSVLNAFSKIMVPETGKKLYDQIEEVSGTSAGSLLTLPYALGYDVNKIQDIVLKNNFGRFYDDSNLSSNNIFYRMLANFIGMSRQDKAELKFLDRYSEVIFDRLIQHIEGIMYSNLATSDEEYEMRLDNIRSELSTMPFLDIKKMCLEVIDEGRVDDWREEAATAVKEIENKLNRNEAKQPINPFEDYGTHLDILIFAIRRENNEDKIQAFLEDMIESRINEIPEGILEEALPSVTTEADKMLIENIKKILGAAAEEHFDDIEERYSAPKRSLAWKDCLVRELRKTRKHGKDCCSKNKCHQAFGESTTISSLEVDVAIDAISKMAPHEIYRIGRESQKSIRIYGGTKGTSYFKLPNGCFKRQRVIYKRKLNFHELHRLSNQLPQYGFKKLHVSMCEIKSLTKWFSLADASAENPEFNRMPLSQAIRHSMNIPLVFDTITYKDRKFVDGGLVSNLPNHFFLENLSKSHDSTLSCLTASDDFFLKHNTFKEALSAGVANKFLYAMNPNYKRISYEDLMRSIIIRSGDVQMAEFGVDKGRKMRLIKKANRATYESLMSQEDVQLRYLKDRLDILHSMIAKEVRSEVNKFARDHSQVIIRPGIFSTRNSSFFKRGEMEKLHRSLRPGKEDLIAIKKKFEAGPKGTGKLSSVQQYEQGYNYGS